MTIQEKQIFEKEVRTITNKIVKEYQPEKIVLFGSHAWGKPSLDSDVDFFIVKDTNKNSLEMIRDVNRIVFNRTIAMDILVYTPKQLKNREKLGDPFVKKILTSGKVLYAR